MKCYFCGAEAGDEKIYRNTLCASCGRELKICRNCKFYSPGAQWDCRETISEAVRDRERANFCDWFSPADSRDQKTLSSSNQIKAKNARSDFDKLFG
ncbi:MAG: 60S ribosomal export protein NMD3 [Spirochaetales bacterium]|jgi:hypothetical protein|nr:60S ribosomal export protein NMD3 [Spirochaetales bacterium]